MREFRSSLTFVQYEMKIMYENNERNKDHRRKIVLTQVVEQKFYAEWESQFRDGRVSLLRSVVPAAPGAWPCRSPLSAFSPPPTERQTRAISLEHSRYLKHGLIIEASLFVEQFCCRIAILKSIGTRSPLGASESPQKDNLRMRRGLVILAIVASAVVVGYRFFYPTFSYHVRLSVAVDRRGRTLVGSSVIEISEVSFPTFGFLDEGLGFESRGEAAFLDMGDGNNLTALLGMGGFSNDDIVKIAQRTFFDETYQKNPEFGTLSFAYKTLEADIGKPRDLIGEQMPTLARFRDVDVPKTIEAVNPADLESSYGPGFRLLKVTLEVTHDSVTSGVIEKRLPWLHGMIGNWPNDKATVYSPALPELGQESIFFQGFVRK
jgi:hypothetical protein